jgi:hypothetical protein
LDEIRVYVVVFHIFIYALKRGVDIFNWASLYDLISLIMDTNFIPSGIDFLEFPEDIFIEKVSF